MLGTLEDLRLLRKARRYVSNCDGLGFHYKLNDLGQLAFTEGEDYAAYYELRADFGMSEKKNMAAVRLVLEIDGRRDQPRPYDPDEEGIFLNLNHFSGAVA